MVVIIRPDQTVAVSYFRTQTVDQPRDGADGRRFFQWAIFTLWRQYAAYDWLSDCG